MSLTAIFGGTFNPFHIGHLQMLRSLCNANFIDKVLLIPDKIPPHKTCEFLASDEDRINMCLMAAARFEKAEVSLIEFERSGKSYTYDTVCLLKEMFPKTNFAVVCGADMISSLDTWHRFADLKDLVSFLAFNRGLNLNFMADIERMRNLGAEITVMPDLITDVSSTELRRKAVPELIPADIYKYITEKGIYNGN